MRKILMIILAIIMLVSGTVIIARQGKLKKENEEFSKIQMEMTQESTQAETPEIVPQEPVSKYEAPAALLDTMEQYPDCIGYIDIENTNVSYPIMQNPDNEYYLHRNMDGEESASGCIYMDSNHDINEKGLHVIYGHHMKNGKMFNDVADFVDEQYMEEHQKISIKTADREINLKPIYCYADVSDGTYRNKITSSGHLMQFVKEHTGLEIAVDDLYVLITCSYGQADERTYLYCIPE